MDSRWYALRESKQVSSSVKKYIEIDFDEVIKQKTEIMRKNNFPHDQRHFMFSGDLNNFEEEIKEILAVELNKE